MMGTWYGYNGLYWNIWHCHVKSGSMDQLVSKASAAKVERNQKKLLRTSDMSYALYIVLPSLFGRQKVLSIYLSIYIHIYIYTYNMTLWCYNILCVYIHILDGSRWINRSLDDPSLGDIYECGSHDGTWTAHGDSPAIPGWSEPSICEAQIYK